METVGPYAGRASVRQVKSLVKDLVCGDSWKIVVLLHVLCKAYLSLTLRPCVHLGYCEGLWLENCAAQF